MIYILSAINTIEEESERALLNRLFIQYASKIKGMAYRIMGNQQDAEDALGNTFLKIIKYRKNFVDINGDAAERLIVIYTRSTCFDMLDKRDKFEFISLCGGEETEDGRILQSEIPAKIDVLEEYIRRERIRDFGKKIRALQTPAKEILLLKYYYDTSNTEIGDILGINVSTVSTIIQRSTRKIQKEMEAHSYEE